MSTPPLPTGGVGVYASPDVLDSMSRDSWWPTRWKAAYHKNTSAATLTRLASDADLIVRNGVMENPNTPPLVRLYLQTGQYGGMTLQEFLDTSESTSASSRDGV